MRLALAAALVVLPLVAACRDARTFPEEAWEERTPESLGLAPEPLAELARSLGGHGMVVVDGYVVAHWGRQHERFDWLSAAKPVLSTLLLFAVSEERIPGPDARVADFGWKLHPKDRDLTLAELANMTGGYARPEPPGAAFAYNDFGVQLLQKTLFDRIYREKPERVAGDADRLGALGFADGIDFDARHRRLAASVRDYARIAWLWLNRGRWAGRQLLPAALLDAAMQPQVPPDLPHTRPARTDDYLGVGSFGGGSDHFTRAGPGIYGYGWWFNAAGRDHPGVRTWPGAPADVVLALGHGGQGAALFPKRRAIVVAGQAHWGELEPGDADARLNQVLALAARAVTPVGSEAAPPPQEDQPALAGELRTWHRVSLTFAGPEAREDGDPNPFRDYRLDVTFRHGDDEVTVPGFFAADGNAAESGATSGNRWRVYFAPDLEGTWTWRASFRRGEDVALADDPSAGRSAAFDGAEGRFAVVPSDKGGRDFRGQGLLRYVGQRYLRFAGSGEWFLKGGANSPENLLAYAGFDQTRPTHHYAPHERDALPGDPLWRGDRGRGLLGALRYLSDKGMNAVYFLTMNVNGDGDDVWPWTDRDTRDRYDISKLAQWEIVFSQMDRLGLLLHVVTQETENDHLLDGGALGPERRLYYRELVARFAHHPALLWNLGEENTNSDAQRRAFAAHLRALDPYDHPVVVHTHPGAQDRVYAPLLGDPDVAGASLQTRRAHGDTQRWVARSREAGHPWVVSLDEIGPARVGVPPDAVDPTHDDARELLWSHLLAGGAGVEWYFGYDFPDGDLDLEDWRSRNRLWPQTRHALKFFRRYLPFPEMTPCDELLHDARRGHCLGIPGELYVLYLPRGGDSRLDLGERAGRFRVEWYDPRKGGRLRPAGERVGPGPQPLGPPPGPGDWVALVRAREARP